MGKRWPGATSAGSGLTTNYSTVKTAFRSREEGMRDERMGVRKGSRVLVTVTAVATESDSNDETEQPLRCQPLLPFLSQVQTIRAAPVLSYIVSSPVSLH